MADNKAVFRKGELFLEFQNFESDQHLGRSAGASRPREQGILQTVGLHSLGFRMRAIRGFN